jgi:PAS domain S-box-containing protein
MKGNTALTGRERTFEDHELIVSKTDLKGRITYANEIFWRISGYVESELLGQPHSLIRHPETPRAVFKLLWDTVQAGQEIFAYVNNRCKNGDYYWVLAHVTPSFGPDGAIVGYHSNRRPPNRRVLSQIIEPLYAELLAIEESHTNRKQGLEASFARLQEVLKERGLPYDEFIATLAA